MFFALISPKGISSIALGRVREREQDTTNCFIQRLIYIDVDPFRVRRLCMQEIRAFR